MIDREKVVKGLECCAEDCVDGCPYEDLDVEGWNCTTLLCRDALELLKAQEPDKDWISKKRLQDEIQYYIDEAGWGEEINKALGWCLEFIDNQEAVKWDD